MRFPLPERKSLVGEVTPVSYTHLDVYKRQDMHVGDGNWGNRNYYASKVAGSYTQACETKASPSRTVGYGSEAVSYTHLDVYKRQVETYAVLGLLASVLMIMFAVKI